MAPLTCHESLQPIHTSPIEGTDVACHSSIAPQRCAEWSPLIAPARWQVLLFFYFIFTWLVPMGKALPSPIPTSTASPHQECHQVSFLIKFSKSGQFLRNEVPQNTHATITNSSIIWKQQPRHFSICAILNPFLCR